MHPSMWKLEDRHCEYKPVWIDQIQIKTHVIVYHIPKVETNKCWQINVTKVI